MGRACRAGSASPALSALPKAQSSVASVFWCHEPVRPGSLRIWAFFSQKCWQEVSVWQSTWLCPRAGKAGAEPELEPGGGRRRPDFQNLQGFTLRSAPGKRSMRACLFQGKPGTGLVLGTEGGTSAPWTEASAQCCYQECLLCLISCQRGCPQGLPCPLTGGPTWSHPPFPLHHPPPPPLGAPSAPRPVSYQRDRWLHSSVSGAPENKRLLTSPQPAQISWASSVFIKTPL